MAGYGKSSIRDKRLGMGRGARNSYGKFGSKVPPGESGWGKKGTARGKGHGPKRGKKGGKTSYDPMSGSQYRQKH